MTVGRSRMIVLCAGIACGPHALRAQSEFGTITGVVRDSAGNGIHDADVFLANGGLHVRTAGDGAFRLPRVAAGSVQVLVRRMGFRPSVTSAAVIAARTMEISILLTPVPEVLAAVRVQARPQPFDARLAGYRARVGHADGRFITRAQIDRLSNTGMIDALRRLPGVRVVEYRTGRSVSLGGAHCAPTVFVDGFAATGPTFDLDMIDLKSVEGVEVYTGSTSAPPELVPSSGKEGCGVIAIWSRPFQPRPQRASPEIDIDQLLARKLVFSASQVDSVTTYRGGAEPAYPYDELAAGLAGHALMEFVVDTLGAVEPGTIRVVSATDSSFSAAARNALANAEFNPAILGGRRVRQVVQMPFNFDPGTVRRPPVI